MRPCGKYGPPGILSGSEMQTPGNGTGRGADNERKQEGGKAGSTASAVRGQAEKIAQHSAGWEDRLRWITVVQGRPFREAMGWLCETNDAPAT
jgi:hypothetical protein